MSMRVNPPGAYLNEGDVMMTEVELANWEDEGGPEYRPRLRDKVQLTQQGRTRMRAVPDEDDERLVDCD